ncbi:putative glycolipid-binding domain-containing protein [Niabella sp. W65]|nr:putative glycolipid-binding domain-containing protein [Niabella sp. W65]MCH7363573.1 putative glycolipid-binding domain-containing protein [Niabella sp. W65]
MKSFNWKGLLYDSTEQLQLSESRKTIKAQSDIIGSFQNNNYIVRYNAEITRDWKVANFQVVYAVNGSEQEITGIKEDGDWIINGAPDPHFRNFHFIDISLTPFTNTLPINNLNMTIDQEQEIAVIYIDILNGDVKPVRQRYRKLTETKYRYENVPNDFTAAIQVDKDGFVVLYPGLFERINHNTIKN